MYDVLDILMAMKRTTVFADEDDLASLRLAARRLGVAEAVLLREAIHRAALSARRWDEPFFTALPPDAAEGPTVHRDVIAAVEDVRSDQAAAYEKTRLRPR